MLAQAAAGKFGTILDLTHLRHLFALLLDIPYLVVRQALSLLLGNRNSDRALVLFDKLLPIGLAKRFPHGVDIRQDLFHSDPTLLSSPLASLLSLEPSSVECIH